MSRFKISNVKERRLKLYVRNFTNIGDIPNVFRNTCTNPEESLNKCSKRELIPFHETLRQLRENAGHSQKNVSHVLGYQSSQFVSNWERGLSDPPVQTLKYLAKLYNIKLKDLAEVFIAYKVSRIRSEIESRLQL
ncbi:MAG: XRE family transcriptional regulator [Proteobacteria bacterium]|nr:MAG: XRE family transcriptional regulator [Pseudomonadota bacterium]